MVTTRPLLNTINNMSDAAAVPPHMLFSLYIRSAQKTQVAAIKP